MLQRELSGGRNGIVADISPLFGFPFLIIVPPLLHIHSDRPKPDFVLLQPLSLV
jgi:hypothetical protein